MDLNPDISDLCFFADLPAEEAKFLTGQMVEPSRVNLLTASGHLACNSESCQLAAKCGDIRKHQGQFWPALWPDAARAPLEAALSAVQEGDLASCTVAGPDEHGEEHLWEVTFCGIEDSPGVLNSIAVIVRDTEGRAVFDATRVALRQASNRR